MLKNDWYDVLNNYNIEKKYKKLFEKINNEYKKGNIFPKKDDLFNAFKFTEYKNIKVVILGQDPYHGVGEAEGLAFSVNKNVKRPPSLRNIFKELENDLNIKRENNSLFDWAEQGVFLLNSVLSVVVDKPASHKNIGWEEFTNDIIKLINEKSEPVVFILWGNFARSKKKLITNKKHLILESAHPSPLSASRGFFGSKPFSKTNDFLKNNNIDEIRW